MPAATCLVATIAICLLTAGSGPDAAAARASVTGSPQALLIECSHGKRPSDRSALFSGQMDQIADATGMRMRFDLSERIGSSTVWRDVASPALRTWRYADPGVLRFLYRQRVDGLKEATAYRMTVRFRWLADDGSVVAKNSARSPVCRQPGKLPNLAVRDDVRARSGPTGGTYRYVVTFHNNGRVSSPPTKLKLRVDGAEVDVRPIGRLQPGERRRVRFVGPACEHDVQARIDPGNRVREITESDNLRTVPCEQALVSG
jgi:CARDB